MRPMSRAPWQRQEKAGIAGGVFEIGVFAGKYLSLLYHATEQTGEAVLGLDTFQWSPQAKVIENFDGAFGQHGRLRLWAADSTTIGVADVIQRLGGRPRFISIDGAHTAAAVQSDLNLSEQLLGEGGIVAIDDILNSRAIGVSEGAYRYFLSRNGQGLVPVAYCANKMFASRPGDLPAHRAAIDRWIKDNGDLSVVNTYHEMAKNGPHWVEQECSAGRC